MALEPIAKPAGLPDHEELLLDYAIRLRRHTAGRRAVHLHMSKLRAQNRRPHYLRIAGNSFTNLINDHEGQIYRLKNGDIVVIVKNASIAQIDQVVLRVKYLFGEDPLIDAEGADGETFVSWYDLENEYDRFVQFASGLHDDYVRLSSAARDAAFREAPYDDLEDEGTPLDPQQLGRLIEVLATSDVTSLLRRQTVCAVLPGQSAQPVFNEIFISISQLRDRVMPGVNLMSDRWLFQHLTEALDSRLLRALPDAERAVELPASVNLNISTILSDEFANFDRQFRIMTQKTLVVEVQSVDIFADMAAFIFARDFLHERGCRVCLDGLNHMTFPLIRREELGVDLEKIYWDSNAGEDVWGEKAQDFRQAVRNTGAARVILCRCDDRQALEFGHEHGITLFQGRYIERLLSAASGG